MAVNSALWLYNILVVNDVANCGRQRDSLGHGQHIYIWFPSTLLHCWFVKLPMPCSKNSVAVKGFKDFQK